MAFDDLNTWRSLITLLSLVLFVGLMVWTWNSRQKPAFDEAAQLPFLDDDMPPGAADRK